MKTYQITVSDESHAEFTSQFKAKNKTQAIWQARDFYAGQLLTTEDQVNVINIREANFLEPPVIKPQRTIHPAIITAAIWIIASLCWLLGVSLVLGILLVSAALTCIAVVVVRNFKYIREELK